MSAYGVHRVRLDVDLQRYHPHLTPGIEGSSVPGAKTTDWGWQDRFWAVRYDCCGHLMDTIAGNLTVLDPDPDLDPDLFPPIGPVNPDPPVQTPPPY